MTVLDVIKFNDIARVLDDMTTPRPLSEYHEDMGDVLWWKLVPCQCGGEACSERKWLGEPPYVGNPNCLGYTVEIVTEVRSHAKKAIKRTVRTEVGGWPGYHTHFTPLPRVNLP